VKILLVQAYLGRKEITGPIFPLGLAYLAGVLKDHDVRMLDMNVEDDPYAALSTALSDRVPDVVGLSLRNIDTTLFVDRFLYFKTVAPTAALIKKTAPHAKTVIGGAAFSMYAMKIMERVADFDIGVYKEAEASFPELLENLDSPEKVKGIFFRDNGTVRFTGDRELPDFSSLPLPDRSLLDLAPYQSPCQNIGVQTIRGCPLRCAYCSYPFLNGSCLRLRSVKHVVDEIQDLVEVQGLTEFMFVDTIFNASKKHATKLCQEIVDRGIKVKWNAYYDVKFVDEDFLQLAHRAGCQHFMFSPDAITDEGLKRLQKNFTVADIHRTISMMRSMVTARSSYSIFVNHPGQTLSGVMRTIAFYLKTNAILKGRGKVYLNWIRVEPDTPIEEAAREAGVITDDTELLPADESGLKCLFYDPPPVKYAGPIAMALVGIADRLKPMIKALLGIRSA
jgi:radical SAM superfamily enzyme YgiQ (UPF0313 family)